MDHEGGNPKHWIDQPRIRLDHRGPREARRALGVAASGLAAAALFGCASLKPPLTCPKEGGAAWVEVKSKHFTLQSDLSEDKARDVLLELEQTYQAFNKLAFRSQNPPTDQIDVVVFDRAADYEEIAPPKTDGFYTHEDLDEHPTMVIKSGYSLRVRAIVQHELTHRFVGYFMPRAPLWLNDGLAEFYETMRFEDGQAVLGEVNRSWRFYNPALYPQGRGTDITRLPSATEILSASQPVFYDPEKKHLFYAGSWFLVSMLINGRADYQRRFWAFVHKLSDGTLAEDAWRASFAGVSNEALDEELRHYMFNGKTTVRRARFEPDAQVSATAAPMSDADVHVLWAKLHLRRRGDEMAQRAGEELDEALRQDPDLAEAHHWRGLLASSQKRYADAEAEFRAAATAQPSEPRYIHGLATAVFRQELRRPSGERDWTRLKELLAKLAKVARSPSALNFLGWCYAQMDRTEEGLVFAKRAVDAEPGCWECLDTLALLAFQKGWAREALDLQLRAVSLLPHTRAVSKDVFARLQRYEAAVKVEGNVEGDAAKRAPAEPGGPAAPAVSPGAGPSPQRYDASAMSRPTMISGKDPVFTKEALDACVEGRMIVRCTITTAGAITNCRVIKSVPHMEAAVISALESRRYAPVLFQGKPVAVDYVFNVNLVLPPSCSIKPPPTDRSKEGTNP
jgi:tetratricopeptide (TPR) repeat protein